MGVRVRCAARAMLQSCAAEAVVGTAIRYSREFCAQQASATGTARPLQLPAQLLSVQRHGAHRIRGTCPCVVCVNCTALSPSHHECWIHTPGLDSGSVGPVYTQRGKVLGSYSASAGHCTARCAFLGYDRSCSSRTCHHRQHIQKTTCHGNAAKATPASSFCTRSQSALCYSVSAVDARKAVTLCGVSISR